MTVVEGYSPAGQADRGRPPVKVGGRYNVTLPTLADGQAGDAQLGPRGALRVEIASAGLTAGAIVNSASADGNSPNSPGLITLSEAFIYNGASFDRARTPSSFKDVTDGSITAGTPAAAWTPAAGKKFRLMLGQLSLSVAGQIILKDGATEILRSPKLAAGGVWEFDLKSLGKLSALANNVLNIDVSGTGNVGGFLGGTEE